MQCCIYENAASAENGIYLCADQAILAFEGEPLQEQIYDVILINTDAISRAERVWRYADGSEKKQSESYLNSRQLLLYSWKNNEEGCTVWQYFYDKWDDPIEYTETVGEQTETSVLKWVDYLQSPEAMEWDGEKQISIPDFPGVTFTYTPMQVYATVSFDSEEPEHGHTILFDGMPIQNVYFTDLNSDGFAELCATVNYGSGIIDTHVVVVDYKNGEQYTLCERSVNDYALRELNGRLVCYKWAYLNGKISDYGHLAIRDGELILVSDVVPMEPTTAAVSGVFDAYLYLPLDGANYRYERILNNSATLTQGEELYTFREGEGADAVVWYVYALNEYPDYSVVLVGAGGEHFLYRYSPPKAASPTALTQAKLSGKIVIEDGYATCGQAAWADFYRRSTDGEQVSINIVHYTTIGDRSNFDDTYYEVYREDYPSLSEFELTYDGSEYTLRLEDSGVELVRTYRYLRKFEEAISTVESAHEPQSREIYLLTDDRTASLETFWQSIVSSQMEDSISFAVVYSEKIVR